MLKDVAPHATGCKRGVAEAVGGGEPPAGRGGKIVITGGASAPVLPAGAGRGRDLCLRAGWDARGAGTARAVRRNRTLHTVFN